MNIYNKNDIKFKQRTYSLENNFDSIVLNISNLTETKKQIKT